MLPFLIFRGWFRVKNCSRPRRLFRLTLGLCRSRRNLLFSRRLRTAMRALTSLPKLFSKKLRSSLFGFETSMENATRFPSSLALKMFFFPFASTWKPVALTNAEQPAPGHSGGGALLGFPSTLLFAASAGSATPIAVTTAARAAKASAMMLRRRSDPAVVAPLTTRHRLGGLPDAWRAPGGRGEPVARFLRHGCHRGARSRAHLLRGCPCRRGRGPGGGRARDLRVPRPERRRQDHHRPDAHHPAGSHRRLGERRGARRRRRCRRRPARDWRGPTGGGARPADDGARAHSAPGDAPRPATG